VGEQHRRPRPTPIVRSDVELSLSHIYRGRVLYPCSYTPSLMHTLHSFAVSDAGPTERGRAWCIGKARQAWRC
jgi:hypothetical protein